MGATTSGGIQARYPLGCTSPTALAFSSSSGRPEHGRRGVPTISEQPDEHGGTALLRRRVEGPALAPHDQRGSGAGTADRWLKTVIVVRLRPAAVCRVRRLDQHMLVRLYRYGCILWTCLTQRNHCLADNCVHESGATPILHLYATGEIDQIQAEISGGWGRGVEAGPRV